MSGWGALPSRSSVCASAPAHSLIVHVHTMRHPYAGPQPAGDVLCFSTRVKMLCIEMSSETWLGCFLKGTQLIMLRKVFHPCSRPTALHIKVAIK